MLSFADALFLVILDESVERGELHDPEEILPFAVPEHFVMLDRVSVPWERGALVTEYGETSRHQV